MVLLVETYDTSWFAWPRKRHSAKPEAFYDIVESMSPGPYLDVFARRLRMGWDCWGNEVYPVPGLPVPDGAPTFDSQEQDYAELAEHFAFHHPSQVARYGAAITKGCRECERG